MMHRHFTLHASPFIFFVISLVMYSTSVAAKVYMTPKETLAQFFQQSDVVRSVKKTITPNDRRELKKQLGYPLERDSVTFYVGKTGEKIDGYAVLDNQIGKTQPITFMTLISPQGEVEQIEVLVYRESHGSEVRHRRFLKQYHKKNVQDRLKLGQDIINITGATLSARAISIGVRRALVLRNYFFGTK